MSDFDQSSNVAVPVAARQPVCTLMRVSQRTVLRWMKDQDLPVISVGPGLRRVQLSHFRAWLLQADEIRE